MLALPSATTLCRVLLGLDRAGASGTLHVHGEGRSATLSLESGLVVGANVDRRVATSQRQVFENVLQVCGWEGLVLRFAQSASAPDWWRLHEPIPARTVALRTMRAAVRSVDTAKVRSDLGDAVYHLTDAGEALCAGAELRPEETAVLFWLRRGVPGRGASRPCRAAVWPAIAFSGCSSCSGGAAARRVARIRCSFASAARCAGMPPPTRSSTFPKAPAARDARVALRKLVRDLHPDRFGEAAPPALRRASGEIVTALVNAEASIASGRRD